jgi:hypothetical protein
LSEALRNRLAQIKEDDPEKRTWAEVIASNLIEVAGLKISQRSIGCKRNL